MDLVSTLAIQGYNYYACPSVEVNRFVDKLSLFKNSPCMLRLSVRAGKRFTIVAG